MSLLLALLVHLAHAATTFPTPITLKTADGVSLHAVYGAPTKAANGVVFVHMAGRAKEDWQLLAEKLARAGVQVLAVDLRGHGANAVAGAAPPTSFAPMVADVKAAVDYLRAKGCVHVALVGAEVGANLAINEAADDPGITDVVLLSPGLDLKGVITSDAVKRYGARPLLIVASEDDPVSARAAGALDRIAAGPKRLVVFEKAGKGTVMLNREPTLESTLIGWIQAHWAAADAPPPPPAAGPDIKVDAHPIETSGPAQPEPVPQ